jgi:hypothetical protein
MKARDYSDDYYQLKERTYKLFSSASKEFQLVNDHEILAGGNLFDIVKTETVNGKTLYYTFCDEEEDGYVQQLGRWGKSCSQEQSLPPKTEGLQIGKYVGAIKYYSPVFTTSLRVNDSFKLSNDLFQYISPLKIVFSPPPDLIVS